MKYKQPEGLISVLLDPDVWYGDKLDATHDLGDYDEPEALSTLITSLYSEEDDVLIDKHAESIFEIWRRNDSFDPQVYRCMPDKARRYLYRYLRNSKPEWIEKFSLPDEIALYRSQLEDAKKGHK